MAKKQEKKAKEKEADEEEKQEEEKEAGEEKETKPKAETKETNREQIEGLIESLQSRFGEGAVMRLGEAHHTKVEVISTGSFSLDLALGVGGFPKGRIIEIYGPEMSGKTTLSLHAIAEVQKEGGRAAFIDAEHALDPEYAKRIGVKINDLIISQPDNGEEGLNILETLVRSGMIDIIVIDSVAALTPQAEIEGEMGAHHVGLQARMMSQALRKITALADNTKTTVIFINQIRMKIGVRWGNPETTTGGIALKFYSSVRIDIRRIAQIKKGDDVIGNRTKAKVAKNKVAPPFKITEFDIMYGEGISYEADVLNTALKYGAATKSGASYSFEGERLGTGFDNVRKQLKDDKKLLGALKKATLEKIKEKERQDSQ